MFANKYVISGTFIQSLDITCVKLVPYMFILDPTGVLLNYPRTFKDELP